MFYAWSKHIKFDDQFAREKVIMRTFFTQYISTLSQPIDIFTKETPMIF